MNECSGNCNCCASAETELKQELWFLSHLLNRNLDDNKDLDRSIETMNMHGKNEIAAALLRCRNALEQANEALTEGIDLLKKEIAK